MSSRRPSAETFRLALTAAARRRDMDEDPDHLAECLLYLDERQHDFETLLRYTDRYLRFGMPEHELTEMRRLVDRLREAHLAVDEGGEVDSTLPI